MEPLSIIFSVVLVILAVVLIVVGIQIVLVLSELRRTLKKVNTAVESTEKRIDAIIAPLQSIGGAAAGLKSGLVVFESFVGWLNRNKDNAKK